MNLDFIYQYEPDIRSEDINEVTNYFKSGGFITEFKKTREFENMIAGFCGCNQVSIFPNGTLTLYSILKQLNISSGQKVVVPNYTMAASAFAVEEIGAEIIFCDIEWPSLCISKNHFLEILQREKSKISALIFVPANGRFPTYEINELIEICKSNNIFFIEDSAQALGSYYSDGQHIGTKGIAGSISFSMPKIITTGQGGAIISSNKELMDKIKIYRDFGRVKGGGADFHDEFGMNFKFTDLQSALGISQLKRIKEIMEIKKNNYSLLKKIISNKYLYLLENNIEFTTPWFYEIVTEHQFEFIEWLKINNIGCRIMYPELNKQKAFRFHKQHNEIFKFSQKISNQGVWIPSHPKLSEQQIYKIAEIINKFKPQ